MRGAAGRPRDSQRDCVGANNEEAPAAGLSALLSGFFRSHLRNV